LRKFENGIDALLFGIIDKAAGVHDDNLSLGIIAIVSALIAVSLHQAHQYLAVNEILRASERYNVYRFQNSMRLIITSFLLTKK